MGAIEDGVRLDLRKLGVAEPTTALETAAISLARWLDAATDASAVTPLARELRLTMAAVADQPAQTPDEADRIAAQCRES
jgi:hypothetical protein